MQHRYAYNGCSCPVGSSLVEPAAAEDVVGRQGLVDTSSACGPIIVSCMEAARHCRVLTVNPRASSARKDPWTRPHSSSCLRRPCCTPSSSNICERLGRMHSPCNVRCPPQLDAISPFSDAATLAVPNRIGPRPSEPRSVSLPRRAICIVLAALQWKKKSFVLVPIADSSLTGAVRIRCATSKVSCSGREFS